MRQVCQADPDGQRMTCPALNLKALLTDMENPPEILDLFVQLDAVRLLEQQEVLRHFQYFPDPKFFPFSEAGKLRVFDVNNKELELLVRPVSLCQSLWCFMQQERVGAAGKV